MKFFARILVVSTFTLFFAPATAFSAEISGFDTVAGFGTLLKAEEAPSGTEVLFRVTKPDGAMVVLRAFSGRDFQAAAFLPEKETRIAGQYKVSTEYNGQSLETYFQVFPGDFNPQKSGVYLDKKFVAANGVDPAKITVRIVDDYLNPIASREISLSSNPEVRILALQDETDEQGLAKFLVSSDKKGVATITAFDAQDEEQVGEPVNVTFFRAANFRKAIGGDPAEYQFVASEKPPVLLASSHLPSDVKKLEIRNLAATVSVNEATSFTVEATNDSGQVVAVYNGQIAFSSTDANAALPTPYSFQPADQGKKTFDLGLTFKTAGTHTLTVADATNNALKGQKTVTVLAVSAGTSGPVRITKPATGTYSVKTLSVEGEVSPNSKVKIFDKGVLLAEVLANQTGRFVFVTGVLADGLHTFHAESNGVSSTPVTITIDTTPAQIEGVEISNKELGPGDQTEIVIRTDTDVSSVQATVGDSLTDLVVDPQNPGVFRGTLVAPATDGEHTINVIITDKQGNVAPPKEVGKLKVDVSLKSFASTFSVPSKVKQFAAVAGNARVNLAWSPASSETGIAFYRIYYGTDPASLTLVANTKDAATTWYIPNLQNGTKYFFQVVGVDTNGVEGDNRSDFAFATPDASAGPPVLCEPEPCPTADYPPTTPEDGPGILGVIAVSLFSGGAWQIWRKRKK